MKYFDLHCDTLEKCVSTTQVVEKNECSVDVAKLSKFDFACQVYAAFMHDSLSSKEALESFNRQYSLYKFTDFKKTGHILSVENAALLDHSIYRLHYLYHCGVRVLSMTWNGENSMAGGSDTDLGLTSFGRQVIKECQSLGIVIDISHLCDKSAYETISRANEPIIATHSNSRAICNHKRNLPDDILKSVFQSKGLVGLNLHIPFLCDDYFPGNNVYEQIVRNIEKMLRLGGENCISLGTDFDGGQMPKGL